MCSGEQQWYTVQDKESHRIAFNQSINHQEEESINLLDYSKFELLKDHTQKYKQTTLTLFKISNQSESLSHVFGCETKEDADLWIATLKDNLTVQFHLLFVFTFVVRFASNGELIQTKSSTTERFASRVDSKVSPLKVGDRLGRHQVGGGKVKTCVVLIPPFLITIKNHKNRVLPLGLEVLLR